MILDCIVSVTIQNREIEHLKPQLLRPLKFFTTTNCHLLLKDTQEQSQLSGQGMRKRYIQSEILHRFHMRIRQNLPQFEDREAVLLVTGLLAGEVFRAHNGVIVKIDEFEVPKPNYSDREGLFGNLGRNGKLIGTGATFEVSKQDQRNKFLTRMQASLRRAFTGSRHQELYVFAPQYALGDVKAALPSTVRRAYKMSFQGNYVHEHPFTLLTMIAQRNARREQGRRPLKEEVMRILRMARLNPR